MHLFSSLGGRMVAACRVSDLGKVQVTWHAGLEHLPAVGGGDAARLGHGLAGLPLHRVLLPWPAAFAGSVPPSPL